MNIERTKDGIIIYLTNEELAGAQIPLNLPKVLSTPKIDPYKFLRTETKNYLNELKSKFGYATFPIRTGFAKEMNRKYFVTNLSQLLLGLKDKGIIEVVDFTVNNAGRTSFQTIKFII